MANTVNQGSGRLTKGASSRLANNKSFAFALECANATKTQSVIVRRDLSNGNTRIVKAAAMQNELAKSRSFVDKYNTPNVVDALSEMKKRGARVFTNSAEFYITNVAA